MRICFPKLRSANTSEYLFLVIPIEKGSILSPTRTSFVTLKGTYLEGCLEQRTGTTGMKEPVGSQQSQESMSHPSLRPF